MKNPSKSYYLEIVVAFMGWVHLNVKFLPDNNNMAVIISVKTIEKYQEIVK
jgi:hypothetical protein